MRLDPRDFITGPFRTCPKCGKPSYGTLQVGDHHISRRCRECWHTHGERLPRLAKKVVYLDQMILSNMAKALDPEWRKQRPQTDDYWLRAFDALDRAMKLQLIVCPYSRIHERESVVLPYFPVLRRLYEHLACGVAFEWPTHVHHLQLSHAFSQRLRKEAVAYNSISREQVIHGDLSTWAERIRISVEWPLADPDPEEVRRTRNRSGQAFEAIFARWAKEAKPFAEVYTFERQGLAETIIELLRAHQAAIQKAAATGVVGEDVFNYRIEIDTYSGLCRMAEDAGIDSRDVGPAVLDFLYSGEAFNAPANDISALMMAALARRAGAGQKPPSQGMWNDITIISAYLPYCDAMFLDDMCTSLLQEGPLDERIAYPGQVFSNRTREEFLAYLAGLEAEAGPDHAERIVEVYGESWLTPYRTILADERERRAKREVERSPKDK